MKIRALQIELKYAFASTTPSINLAPSHLPQIATARNVSVFYIIIIWGVF